MSNEDFVIRKGALREAPSKFKEHWGTATPLIVVDANTWKAAGSVVKESFCMAGYDPKVFLLPDTFVPADDEHIALVRQELAKTNAIGVAVGSGVINDLVKRASQEVGRTYMVIPTAASVDGYTAYGAAITVQGFKTTLPCAAPVLVVADTDVLCAAPAAMTASGYGDLAAKIPALADWVIADSLGVEAIRRDIWDMVFLPLHSRIDHPDAIVRRDPDAIQNLFIGLIEAGYAMQRYQDSRPAAGAEHMMSHVWEMEHLMKDGRPVSHGFKVAIGTLISTALMTECMHLSVDDVRKAMQENTNPPYATWHDRKREIDRCIHMKPSVKEAIVDASHKKFEAGYPLAKRQETILARWEGMMRQVKEILLPFGDIQRMLETVGCPSQPQDILLSRDDVARAMRLAPMIRNRYTCLDLAYEAGLQDQLVDTIAYSDTYFTAFRPEH